MVVKWSDQSHKVDR